MASPAIALNKILAAAPATTRGQPTPLSTDSKGQRIAYAVSNHDSSGSHFWPGLAAE